jgi:hypothetical protein
MLDAPADEPWPACEEPHLSNESVLVPLEIRTWDEAKDWVATLGPGGRLDTSHIRLDDGPAWANLDRSEHPPYPDDRRAAGLRSGRPRNTVPAWHRPVPAPLVPEQPRRTLALPEPATSGAGHE